MEDAELERMTWKELADLHERIETAIRATIARRRIAANVPTASKNAAPPQPRRGLSKSATAGYQPSRWRGLADRAASTAGGGGARETRSESVLAASSVGVRMKDTTAHPMNLAD